MSDDAQRAEDAQEQQGAQGEQGPKSEFAQVRDRLAEIADAVADDDLSLDDALDLYEEAVSLGLQASDLLETGVVIPEEEPEGAPEGAAASQAGEAAPAVAGEGRADQAPDQP